MNKTTTIPSSTTVLVALSGGVDSAVVMHLLHQQSYGVIGFSHRHWPESKCCNTVCLDISREQCRNLGVPYHTADTMVEFTQNIVDPFVEDYQNGFTPNPCVLCNEKNRFGTTIDKLIDSLNLSKENFKIATGHYARIKKNNQGIYELKRGLDPKKDQTYMLYRLSQKQLSHCLFPLGSYKKEEVRKLASDYQLASAKKPDSQDICFVETNYRNFINQYNPSPQNEGDFVDIQGVKLGRHQGFYRYSRGQRKGLGLSGGPWFVIEVKVSANQVVLGKKEDLKITQFKIKDCVWNQDPKKEMIYNCQVRYHGKIYKAKVLFQTRKDSCYEIHLESFSNDVTKGQSAVFYQDDTLIGGGIISEFL